MSHWWISNWLIRCLPAHEWLHQPSFFCEREHQFSANNSSQRQDESRGSWRHTWEELSLHGWGQHTCLQAHSALQRQHPQGGIPSHANIQGTMSTCKVHSRKLHMQKTSCQLKEVSSFVARMSIWKQSGDNEHAWVMKQDAESGVSTQNPSHSMLYQTQCKFLPTFKKKLKKDPFLCKPF